jgi:hypothetical protein
MNQFNAHATPQHLLGFDSLILDAHLPSVSFSKRRKAIQAPASLRVASHIASCLQREADKLLAELASNKYRLLSAPEQ